MKNVSIVLFALLALAALAHAHDPPGPQPLCLGPENAHDYVRGRVSHDERQWGPPGPALDGCAEGDGEPELGPNYARLFVVTGDGVTSGAAACHGGVGHHTANVRAQESWPPFGPHLRVVADHARPGAPASTPACGDGILEPCAPPPLSTPPFPLNVVLDAVNGLLRETFCNPLDAYVAFESDASVSGGAVPFPPGADGTYHVLVQDDTNTPRLSKAGHVWTV